MLRKRSYFQYFAKKKFVPVTRVGVRENFHPGYRDLGNRASPTSRMNTSKFFYGKERMACRRDLGNRLSPVDRTHMKKLLKCPNF